MLVPNWRAVLLCACCVRLILAIVIIQALDATMPLLGLALPLPEGWLPRGTICDGDTKGVKPVHVETRAGCGARLVRSMGEFRAQLVVCIPGFAGKPLSWRSMMNSLSYNIGSGAACRSTAARLGIAGRYV